MEQNVSRIIYIWRVTEGILDLKVTFGSGDYPILLKYLEQLVGGLGLALQFLFLSFNAFGHGSLVCTGGVQCFTGHHVATDAVQHLVDNPTLGRVICGFHIACCPYADGIQLYFFN